ncbi:NAD(P)-binding protein [Cyathus striatus]|nr:NAD(P)-binding protein [Cyathus striatus]
MSTKINVLMLGVTGYIGGSSFALQRKQKNATTGYQRYRWFSLRSIVGEELAQENEVVFSLGDADNAIGIQAILKGLKKQFEQTGKAPILIHTSGTGVIATPGNGSPEESDNIYDDANVQQMAGISPAKIHRNIDLSIVAADTEGYVKACIVIPGTIYGIAKTKLTELGVQNAHLYAILRLINVSLDRGKVAIIGDGGNIWPHVSLEDMSRLYIQLYDSLVSDPRTGHGSEGYYFGENGEYTLLEVSKKVGEALFELKKSDIPDPVPLSQDEIAKYFKGAKSSYISFNCRCRGNRSRAIGWTLTKAIGDFLASVKPDVECVLAKAGQI